LLSFSGWKAVWKSGLGPWILTWTALLLSALVLAFASGCGRTVLVSEGSPMRVGPATRAQVWTRVQGEWELSASRVEIPEGWYLMPPSFVEKE
jgi:hypothetical protein